MGGGEKHTLSLVKNLSTRGFNFYFAGSCKVLLEEFEKRKYHWQGVWLGLEPVSIKGLIIFTLLLPYISLRLFFLLLTYKQNKKTNILYCLNLTEKLAATIPAYILGYKVFWMEHLRLERWLLQNPYRPFYVLYSRLATTITVSKSVKKQLVDLGLKDEKVKVIYNGIDTERFKPLDNLAENPNPIIGSAGRLNTEKGMDCLIKAFKK